MAKITIQDCIKRAAKNNGQCLSTKYINNLTKMNWVCEKGHYFSSLFKSIKKGHWCADCAGVKKLTHAFVKKEIIKKNGKLLSHYILSNKKLKVQCLKDNYIWETTWNRIKQNHWCPKCANNSKITVKDIEKCIKNKKGKLIDISNFPNAKSKIIVQCLKDNYIWNTTWDYLKQGNWCPKCAGKILKTYDEFVNFILSKNGKLIKGFKNFNHKTKFKIKCLKDNYIWETTYYSFIYNKSWCPKCAGKVLKSFKEVKDFVKNKNGKLLSKKSDLKYNISKLTIRCEKKHIWDTSYKNLLNNNRWCPYCKSSTMQYKLLSIVSGIFKTKGLFNFKGFEWLKDKQRMEIDIWIPKIKLAIEYDGPHHFILICYNNNKKLAEKKLNDRIKKDQLKNKLIKKHKNDIKYFIRFNYKEKINKENVIKKLIAVGLKGEL